MKNMAQNLRTAKETEWLSLDDYVRNDNHNIIYVRKGGNLLVAEEGRKPSLSDLVLIETPDGFQLEKYADMKESVSPLRLAARNGKLTKQSQSLITVRGVITFRLENLQGVQNG